MQIIRYVADGEVRVGRTDGSTITRLPFSSLAELWRLPLAELRTALEAHGPTDTDTRPLPPVDGLTEVWASGVTYRRSSEARQEESATADVYARVYDAERPELFLKSTAWRVCGPGEPIGIRADSAIDVAEPEVALVINAHAEIVGVTVCNDVSSRSIEGENPLYLPQAKIYSGSCALGPAITPIWAVADIDALGIELTISRGADVVFTETTSTKAMHRKFGDLVAFLTRNTVFPDGAFLSTGTGIVPELTFTLETGDQVAITVDAVGTLSNPVVSATAENFAWLTPDPSRSPS